MHDIHSECLVVVFYPIIKRELHEFVRYWNTHRIRYNSKADCPGIPDNLFDMPSYVGEFVVLLIYTLICKSGN